MRASQSVRIVRSDRTAPFMVLRPLWGDIDFGYERGWGWLVCLPAASCVTRPRLRASKILNWLTRKPDIPERRAKLLFLAPNTNASMQPTEPNKMQCPFLIRRCGFNSHTIFNKRANKLSKHKTIKQLLIAKCLSFALFQQQFIASAHHAVISICIGTWPGTLPYFWDFQGQIGWHARSGARKLRYMINKPYHICLLNIYFECEEMTKKN